MKSSLFSLAVLHTLLLLGYVSIPLPLFAEEGSDDVTLMGDTLNAFDEGSNTSTEPEVTESADAQMTGEMVDGTTNTDEGSAGTLAESTASPLEQVIVGIPLIQTVVVNHTVRSHGRNWDGDQQLAEAEALNNMDGSIDEHREWFELGVERHWELYSEWYDCSVISTSETIISPPTIIESYGDFPGPFLWDAWAEVQMTFSYWILCIDVGTYNCNNGTVECVTLEEALVPEPKTFLGLMLEQHDAGQVTANAGGANGNTHSLWGTTSDRGINIKDLDLSSQRPLGSHLYLAPLEDKSQKLRVSNVSKDPKGLKLYDWQYLNSNNNWTDLCQANRNGSSASYLVPGVWDDKAQYKNGPGTSTIACLSGAIGKCISFGYVPWQTFKGKSLNDYHQACVRMVRADYWGSGTSHTQEGTKIFFTDNLGIHRGNPPKGMRFEASWSPEGAISFLRPRINSFFQAWNPFPSVVESEKSLIQNFSYPR